MKLNKTTLNTLAVPVDKAELMVWDDDVPGFGVQLRTGGKPAKWRFPRCRRRQAYPCRPAPAAASAPANSNRGVIINTAVARFPQ
jgi:hypothetical protein